MIVGTPTNNRIIANLLVALYTALTNQCYAVFVTVQRLWIPERRMATYPDIMVMSEPLTYQERGTDTLINPVLLRFCLLLLLIMIKKINLLLIEPFQLFSNIY